MGLVQFGNIGEADMLNRKVTTQLDKPTNIPSQ